MVEDWPTEIIKPCLPNGYEWHCLRPALGLGESENHPWWIRVTWKTKDGRERFLCGLDGYYKTPQHAIDSAVHLAFIHSQKRSVK